MRIIEIALVFLLVLALFTSFFLVVLDNRTGRCIDYRENVVVFKDTTNNGN